MGCRDSSPHQWGLGQPRSAGSQARAWISTGIASPLPYSATKDRDIAGDRASTHWGDKGQQTGLATREFPRPGPSAMGTDDPRKLCNLHLRGSLVKPGPSNLNYFTILRICIFLVPQALALMSFYLIHIFRYFYIMEKWGEIGTKQCLKVLAEIQICTFAFSNHTYPAVLLSLVKQWYRYSGTEFFLFFWIFL